MQKALDWASASLGDVIDKAAGHKNVLKIASEKLSEVFTDTKSKVQFGVFVNLRSFGILLEFPVGAIFPFHVPLGTISFNCQFHFKEEGLTCAVNYDKPKWVAAAVKDGKMLVGNIKNALGDALDDLKSGVKDDWTHMVNGVQENWGNIQKALTPDHGKKIKAAFSGAKKAKLGGGRKVNAFFKGLGWRL